MKNQPFKIHRYFILAILLFNVSFLYSQVQSPRYTSMSTRSKGYYEYLPLGYSASGTQKYPLLIFAHGGGEIGNGSSSELPRVLAHGTPQQIKQGIFPTSFVVNGQTFRFIVISPQFDTIPSAGDMSQIINYCVSHYNVDTNRIYLTGLSMGGGVIWAYAGHSLQYAQRLAAIVPVCGAATSSVTRAQNIATADVAVWATHNNGDPVVPVSSTINWVNTINGVPNPPNPLARMTIFQSSTHDAWTKTYDLNFRVNNLNVYEWMLQYSNGTTSTVNQPPVSNAGNDVTITLPTNSVQLNGGSSYDPDGTIASYSWAKTAGPTQFTISNSAIVNPVFSNLVAGTYTLQLTVTDNKGAKSSDLINVVVNPAPVNQPPVANAGSDVTITLPTNSVQLNGGNSYDPDGTVASYSWAKTAGPTQFTISNSAILNPVFSNLVAGTYTLQLTVTDNKGAKSSDLINVVVNPIAVNQPPVANAGNDVAITLPTNSVQLSGSGSYDPDGTIVSYAWGKLAGPSQFTFSNRTIVNPIFSNLVAGNYILLLRAQDNAGASTIDTIIVTVNAISVNLPPVANAGADVAITLPINSVTITGSGTDPDGTIASYVWTQVSGPSTSSISSPATARTTISNLILGTYVFNLKITDNGRATASDQMQITVSPATGGTGTKYINVNLYGGSNPYVNSAWNNWNVGTAYTSNVTSPLFTYSDGTLSGVKAVLSYSQSVGDNASNYGSGMAPAQVLEYTSDGQAPRTLTVTGLSTSLKYSFELYASRWSINNSTIFTVNGTSVTIPTYYNLTNKAIFTNITPNAQGQIVIGIRSATGWNYLNGFMITQLGTIGGKVSSATQAIPTSSKNTEELTNERTLSSVEIFPNPVTDKVVMQVANSQSGTMKVQIIDAIGAVKKDLLLKHVAPVSKVNIPVNELSAGIYIIKVQVGNWSSSKKIIKL